MQKRLRQLFTAFTIRAFIVCIMALTPVAALAAPSAKMVIDARSGEVLLARNADARLHPASLTKMMTLYVAFEAIEKGEIALNTPVRISRNAAAEPPSKLGLKAGQTIQFRYLIRAASVKSANDAATAIAEAVSGSESAFVARMNRTAKALGMDRSTFKNAHGLTAKGHLSTARDMTNLGRRLFYDYPQYYNLFSRRTTNAGVRKVYNTNRKFLAAYEGADGIKTGYTAAAGFNLVASAKRGNERIIATVFGGRSTADRNRQVAELLDLGFRRAPSKAPVKLPPDPVYASADPESDTGDDTDLVRVLAAVKSSRRPNPRPDPRDELEPEMLLALKEGVASAVMAAVETEEKAREDEAIKATVAALETQVSRVLPPVPRPEIAPEETKVAAITPESVIDAAPAPQEAAPLARPGGLFVRARRASAPAEQEVVTRASTSGGRQWGITVGKFSSRYSAEKFLLRTALIEIETLDEALRKVINRPTGYEASFVGMTQERADLACRRLSARGVTCFTIEP